MRIKRLIASVFLGIILSLATISAGAYLEPVAAFGGGGSPCPPPGGGG